VRHTISPSVEIRAVPIVLGAPLAYFDELDSAVHEPAVQALVMLRQRVQIKTVGDVVRVDLGQAFNLYPRVTASETFIRGSAAAGWVRGTGTVRFDPLTKRLTRVSALSSIEDGRGSGGYLGYEHLLDVGTDRARQPVDLLIGPRLLGTSAAQAITFGFHWRHSGVGLRYDGLFLEGGNVWTSQQTLGVSYGPACECWRVEAFGTWRGANFPDVGASLTITGFGTLGTGG
jgi:LPS-assembly protein